MKGTAAETLDARTVPTSAESSNESLHDTSGVPVTKNLSISVDVPLNVRHLPVRTVTYAERLHTEHFQLNTVPQLATGLEVDFWGRSALYMVVTEPTVYHAALAVSAVHRQYLYGGSKSDCTDQDNSFALLHYNKAIGLLVGLQQRDIPRYLIAILTSCVLFISFEGSHCSRMASAICLLTPNRSYETILLQQSATSMEGSRF